MSKWGWFWLQNYLQKTYAEKQEQLKRLYQEEIEKLNILTVLQEEGNMIKAQARALRKVSNANVSQCDAEQDIRKLQLISDQQIRQIEVWSIFAKSVRGFNFCASSDFRKRNPNTSTEGETVQ